MQELDISSLTRVPEFEQRCNAFVEEVTSTIKPNYPDLYIDATNETLKNIKGLNKTIQMWKRIIPAKNREKLIRASRRIANRSDKESAFRNFASVDIIDIEGQGRRELVEQAVKDVKEIASKYQQDETSEIIDYDDLGYPSAHLSYLFS